MLNVDQMHKRPGETVKGAILRVLSHEVTHSFEKTSETYTELWQFCYDYAAHQIGVDAVEARIRAIQNLYNEAGLDYNRQDAEAEFVAQSCEQMLQNSDMLVELYKRSTTLYQRFVDAINELFEKLKKIVSAVNENAKLMQGGMDQLQKLWDKCYAEASETIKNTALETSGEIQYSISMDMSEESRYEELIGKNIKVAESSVDEQYDNAISSLENLKGKSISKATSIIIPIAKKIGILNRTMRTPDLDVEFEFSKNKGLNESIHQQKNYGGSYSDFAKALLNIDGILENAVLIEQHSDKYTGTIRENHNLESVSVLFGLFRDGESVIPTQFEIKKYKDKGTKSKLYMTVAMTKIEAGVLGSTVGKSQAHYLIPTSTYSLSDVFSNINTEDKNFLKYIPDGFLSVEQKKSKIEAITEERDRIAKLPRKEQSNVSMSLAQDDAAYLSIAEKYRDGTATEAETEQLRQAVEQAAKKAGYIDNLFHQTENDFTVFDTKHKGAGTRDNETPC